VTVEPQSQMKLGGFGSRIINPLDWFWDVRLGIKTFGYHPAEGGDGEKRWYVHFMPAVYADIFRGFEAVNLGAEDIFTDVGSGLGRVVFAAAHSGVREATGVEYVEALHVEAERNRLKSHLDQARIKFHNADATAFNIAGTTVLFLFHPFGPETMQTVIANLRRDREAAKISTPLRIIYYNPVCAQVLKESGWLGETQSLPAIRSTLGRANRYRISIWESL
jgi:Histone methylation protein DOT1